MGGSHSASTTKIGEFRIDTVTYHSAKLKCAGRAGPGAEGLKWAALPSALLNWTNQIFL
jgi:hypothetical protein